MKNSLAYIILAVAGIVFLIVIILSVALIGGGIYLYSTSNAKNAPDQMKRPIPAPTYTFYPTYTPFQGQTLPQVTQEQTKGIDPSPIPTLTQVPPSPVPVMENKDFTEVLRFSGQDTSTSDPFPLKNGIARIKWNFEKGSIGLFQIFFKNLDTGQVDIIANTSSDGPGQAVLNVVDSDKYLLVINCYGGKWSITVEWRP
jgi:hypothetical protein